VLRSHDRKGIHTCQAVSLHATRGPDKSSGSDNGYYVPNGLDIYRMVLEGERTNHVEGPSSHFGEETRRKWARHAARASP
jgi:hypothetical protein